MRRFASVLAFALPVIVAACGSGSGTIEVSAASSLKAALTRYGASFGHVSFSFAGSDELAAQIRAGARPDVLVAANATIPRSLFKARLVERPVPFATNRLVLAVPAHGARVRSLADAARPGVTIATGSPQVPIGSYTLTVLRRLGHLGQAIRARVRSQEPDDAGIVGKLEAGAVDAGFVYVTDVTASKGSLRAIELPPSAKPRVVYEAAVVAGSGHSGRAKQFIAGLLRGPGAAALAAAGFGSP